MYAGVNIEHFAEALGAITGWDIDGLELLKVGERVINLQRMFNIREGFSRQDDLLPERMKSKPAFGLYKKEESCVIKDFEHMLDEYYHARRWDVKTGRPLDEKLWELGIKKNL